MDNEDSIRNIFKFSTYPIHRLYAAYYLPQLTNWLLESSQNANELPLMGGTGTGKEKKKDQTQNMQTFV